MKINKIRLRNINCLRGDWEIDFTKEPFVSSELFAITGPTGSGKSTLLDAVTLAAFNQIPRKDGILSDTQVEKAGFILTRNESECFVELEYSCAKGTFRSKWSISKNRNGNLRPYEMELIDMANGLPLDIKKSKVPEKNEELIGLSYKQFIQSILLSQGGFAKFLESPKADRSKLLEDITGMDIYRKLGQKAYDAYKQKRDETEDQKRLLENEQQQLLNVEEIAELQRAQREVTDELNKMQDAKGKLEKLQEIKRRIDEIKKEIEGHEKNLRDVKRKEEDFIINKQDKLLRHQQLLPFIENINRYSEAMRRIHELNQALAVNGKELNDKQKERKKLISDLADFISQSTDPASALNDINSFRVNVNELLSQKREKQAEFDLQKKNVNQIIKKPELQNFNFPVDNPEQLCSTVEQELQIIEEQLQKEEQAGINADNYSVQKNNLQKKKETLVELKVFIDQFISAKKSKKNAEDAISDAKRNMSSDEELNKLQNETEQLEIQRQQLHKQLLRQIEETKIDVKSLREQLSKNEPCPVCGSTHHPYAEEFIDRLAEIKNEYNKCEKSLKDKRNLLNQLNAKKSKLEESVSQNQQKLLEADQQLKSLNKTISGLKKTIGIEEIKQPKVVDEEMQEIEGQIKRLDQFEKLLNLKTLLDDLLQQSQTLKLGAENLAQASQAIADKYTGTDINKDCDIFIKKFNGMSNAIQSIEKIIEGYQNEQEQQVEIKTDVEKQILLSLNQMNYISIALAVQHILPAVEFQKLTQEKNNIENEKGRLEVILTEAQRRVSKESTFDTEPELSQQQCADRVQHLNSQIGSTQKAKTEIDAKLLTNEQKKQLAEELQQQIVKTEKANLKWELLNNLIGDATGNKFNNFAQQLTLRKLVGLSNVHLKKLNDRYLIDVPKPHEDDDLMIVDTWLGKERRSVKTLSGGEKFLVSLSLALALSDLASRNVRIESLFIDEGFGTLDAETLDQAVSTLEQLQTQTNKTIGIISHVDALKERILTQIQLEKTSQGFSKLNFIPNMTTSPM